MGLEYLICANAQTDLLCLTKFRGMVRSKPIDAGIVQRFSENVDIPLSGMMETFAVKPQEFEDGLRLAPENWRKQGVV